MEPKCEYSETVFDRMIILMAKSSHYVWERAAIMDNFMINGTELENLLQSNCIATNGLDEYDSISKECVVYNNNSNKDSLFVDENGCILSTTDLIILHNCISELFSEELWYPMKFSMNVDLFFYMLMEVKTSTVFRKKLICQIYENLASKKFTEIAKLQRRHPRYDTVCKFAQLEIQLINLENNFIDKSWNYKMCQLVGERVELENIMAWLSTLGGAYSALGDEFSYCAEVAGKISVKQLQIALKLGDPFTIARCKVYFALSLLQRGFLKKTAALVRQQYTYALSHSENARDHRLINMCKGIWAKLKYAHEQKHMNYKHYYSS